jgi:hypothetical protein
MMQIYGQIKEAIMEEMMGIPPYEELRDFIQ